MLSDGKNETVNHIMSKCSKLVAKEYESELDWVGTVLYLNLCKRIKFGHADIWFMNKPESFLDNETRGTLKYERITKYWLKDQNERFIECS